mmetsp:Transcript_50321/g.155510  ORF Transcript_50321/g.155510 Transcript_50321/m.155510 type:complete len:459 (-) Transcript_50321:176-1552(-)
MAARRALPTADHRRGDGRAALRPDRGLLLAILAGIDGSACPALRMLGSAGSGISLQALSMVSESERCAASTSIFAFSACMRWRFTASSLSWASNVCSVRRMLTTSTSSTSSTPVRVASDVGRTTCRSSRCSAFASCCRTLSRVPCTVPACLSRVAISPETMRALYFSDVSCCVSYLMCASSASTTHAGRCVLPLSSMPRIAVCTRLRMRLASSMALTPWLRDANVWLRHSFSVCRPCVFIRARGLRPEPICDAGESFGPRGVIEPAWAWAGDSRGGGFGTSLRVSPSMHARSRIIVDAFDRSSSTKLASHFCSFAMATSSSTSSDVSVSIDCLRSKTLCVNARLIDSALAVCGRPFRRVDSQSMHSCSGHCTLASTASSCARDACAASSSVRTAASCFSSRSANPRVSSSRRLYSFWMLVAAILSSFSPRRRAIAALCSAMNTSGACPFVSMSWSRWR